MSFELPPEQTGAAAWYGPEIAKRNDWMMPLSADGRGRDRDRHAGAGRARCRHRGAQASGLSAADSAARLKARVDDEVLNGRGFLLLRGLPVDRWSIRESATAFFGLGAHLGSARSQNGKGHVLGHVQDLGMDVNDPNVRIYQTHERQTYHTDPATSSGCSASRPRSPAAFRPW